MVRKVVLRAALMTGVLTSWNGEDIVSGILSFFFRTRSTYCPLLEEENANRLLPVVVPRRKSVK
jgi:hypothetical protein